MTTYNNELITGLWNANTLHGVGLPAADPDFSSNSQGSKILCNTLANAIAGMLITQLKLLITWVMENIYQTMQSLEIMKPMLRQQ